MEEARAACAATGHAPDDFHGQQVGHVAVLWIFCCVFGGFFSGERGKRRRDDEKRRGPLTKNEKTHIGKCCTTPPASGKTLYILSHDRGPLLATPKHTPR